MSIPPRAVSRFRSMDFVICATLILGAGACSRAPAVEPGPAMATPEQRLPHFPGIDVIPLDHGAFEVKIHSGMVGDGAPLYVIDGQPTPVAPTRGIDWLRSEDILRIEVVKNPADLAIYGPQGVNGVVLITTKKGAKPR
jgi:TonB-dependent SusC/RagA subfamily outer membrane receptor